MRDVRLFDVSRDPRERPIFNVTEAADYVGVPRSTLRHWIKPPKNGRALIETQNGKLSFLNLLEAHVLRVVLERDTWLRRVRLGIDTLREKAPHVRHHLLMPELRTASGYRDVFVQTVVGVENISRGGQLAFRQLLSKHLRQIDFDDAGEPFRLRPFRFKHIDLDHRILGGKPAVLNTRISVQILASRNRAGDSIEDLARDYGLDRHAVRDAIRYAA